MIVFQNGHISGALAELIRSTRAPTKNRLKGKIMGGNPVFRGTRDQAKAAVQDLANRASETGRQAMDRAGEFIEGAAPQASQVASNLYDQGSRSGEYVRQYAAEQPLAAMLIAGAIGYALGYLIHGARN